MGYTTRPPRVDVLAVVPELAKLAQWTFRLHPRREPGLFPDANKIGGSILWPKDEPWPECESVTVPDWWSGEWPIPTGARIPLVPVLQVHASACPDVPFFPGTDLLQVLWCPISHSAPIFVAKPHVYWRRATDPANQPTFPPMSEFRDKSYVPFECSVNPERVQEFPHASALSDELLGMLYEWDIANIAVEVEEYENGSDLYCAELSTCGGTKVGGHPHWVQSPEVPKCQHGHEMSFLLALTDGEFDANSKYRWCPTENRERLESPYQHEEIDSAAFPNLGGLQSIFVCRQCPDWPIASVYQR